MKGIAWLAEQIHNLGLKLGIYLNNGKFTCQHFAGSEGFLKEDISLLGTWKVDGLKLDTCYISKETFDNVAMSYKEASLAIKDTGRPMAFICSYPYYQIHGGGMSGLKGGVDPDFYLASQICDTYRFMDDVNLPPADARIRDIIGFMSKHQDDMLAYTGPGHWPDPDMLLLGSHLTEKYPLSLQKIQLVMWIMVSAPLLMSNDPSRLSREALDLLTSPILLRIHRDPLVQAAHRVLTISSSKKSDTAQLWVKPLSNGAVVAAFVNFDATQTVTIHVSVSELGRFENPDMNIPGSKIMQCDFLFNELILPENIGNFTSGTLSDDSFTVDVTPMNVRLFQITAQGDSPGGPHL